MNLFAFIISLSVFCVQFFVYGASLPILAFIPFVALVTLTRPLPKALFSSFGVGLLIDLVSSDPFAIHALNYTLTAFFASRLKAMFSDESSLQFSIYTGFSSFISTLLQIILLFLFDKRILFQGKWWIAQWPLLPVFDALYALLWFAGPLALFRITRRTWMVYWLKKKNPFPN